MKNESSFDTEQFSSSPENVSLSIKTCIYMIEVEMSYYYKVIINNWLLEESRDCSMLILFTTSIFTMVIYWYKP